MKLLWQENEVACIEEEDSDFPTVWGKYSLNESVPSKIYKYIEFCIKHWPDIEDGVISDEYLKDEEGFVDLIESEDWWLMDESSGKKTPILIPVFETHRGVNWRLDASR